MIRLFLTCLFLTSAATPAFPQESKIFLIFPLESKSADPLLSWIGEGVALAMGDALRGAGMNVISREDRMKFVESADLPPGMLLSRASMIRVAQQAEADLLAFGSFSGTADNLQVTLQVLDLHSLRFRGDITGNGALSGLPQIENDMSWLVLVNNGLNQGHTHEQHRKLIRKMSNAAYERHINSLPR